MTRAGLLVMAYGTPASLDELEAYYTHIRRGRPPTAAALDELRDRYIAIGGSPLLEITRKQVTGIARELPGVRVALGMKHAAPFIEDSVEQLLEHGCEHIAGLVLAPHYSHMSVGAYHERVLAQLDGRAAYTAVRSWAAEPAYVHQLARYVRATLAEMPNSDEVGVVFTAHSLPERILERGDPYPDELLTTAAAVAAKAGIDRWSIAWQSAGRTPEPWIGPDILDELERVAQRATGVLVCAAGFVSDHLEVLYDLDIEAAARAAELGLQFARTPSINADSTVMAALAANVQREFDAVAT